VKTGRIGCFGPLDSIGPLLACSFLAVSRETARRRKSELRTQRPLAEIAGRAIQRRQTRTRRALPTRSACSTAIRLPASTARLPM
jgi:hypothetical protein